MNGRLNLYQIVSLSSFEWSATFYTGVTSKLARLQTQFLSFYKLKDTRLLKISTALYAKLKLKFWFKL